MHESSSFFKEWKPLVREKHSATNMGRRRSSDVQPRQVSISRSWIHVLANSWWVEWGRAFYTWFQMLQLSPNCVIFLSLSKQMQWRPGSMTGVQATILQPWSRADERWGQTQTIFNITLLPRSQKNSLASPFQSRWVFYPIYNPWFCETGGWTSDPLGESRGMLSIRVHFLFQTSEQYKKNEANFCFHPRQHYWFSCCVDYLDCFCLML